MTTLYNSIQIDEANWPPDHVPKVPESPIHVPYLDNRPPVIDIRVGRQLFVDDFLIRDTTCDTVHHQPVHQPDPVLAPETELELDDGYAPCAAPFNDGIWYDPQDKLFKLWYLASWWNGTALAVSRDGRHFERQAYDVIPGTNAVVAPADGWHRDGCNVWLDHQAPPAERYKMFQFYRHPHGHGGHIYHSPDGIHWTALGTTGPCGDNTSFFYNPFTKQYVFSIRASDWGTTRRARNYHQAPSFPKAASWVPSYPIPWLRSDTQDLPDPYIGERPQLYDVNSVAYESVMLGGFGIFYGPPNSLGARRGTPKIIDLHLGYSRDGFHYHRPDRRGFIRCSRLTGRWDYGYIHAASGLCTIIDEQLHFYYGAFSGQSPRLGPGEFAPNDSGCRMYAGGHTGLATLRRDGFTSLDAPRGGPGTVTTQPIRYRGQHLFVNIDIPEDGNFQAELLDLYGKILATTEPTAGDHTRHRLTWKSGDLQAHEGTPVQLCFRFTAGSFYAFWITDDPAGASYGYTAAGGPDYPQGQDLPKR